MWLVGTGTSQHAAELGAAMFAEADLDARHVSAMDFARVSPPLASEDGVVLITHTAETAFALAARERALTAEIPLASITRSGAQWAEAIETVPKERSETYTLSYSATLMMLARMASFLGAEAITREQIELVGPSVQRALENPGTDEIAAPHRALVFAGVGPAAVTAREGALKSREAARLIAEGYDAEYLLHGSGRPAQQRRSSCPCTSSRRSRWATVRRGGSSPDGRGHRDHCRGVLDLTPLARPGAAYGQAPGFLR